MRLQEAKVIDENIIRPLDKAYHKEGGHCIIKNLAPDGAVVKQTAVSEKMMRFKGKARSLIQKTQQ